MKYLIFTLVILCSCQTTPKSQICIDEREFSAMVNSCQNIQNDLASCMCNKYILENAMGLDDSQAISLWRQCQEMQKL